MVSPITKMWMVAGDCQEWFGGDGLGCLLDTQGEPRKALMHAGARRKIWAADKVWESSDGIYRPEAT